MASVLDPVLSLFDTPPPFDTQGVAFQCVRAAAMTFSAAALVAVACPREWTALQRSHVVALLHGVLSFSLSIPVVLKHWDDLLDWGRAPTAERMWFGYGPEYAVPCSVVFGYLAFDFLLGTVLSPGMLDAAMIFHHLVGMVAAVMGAGLGFGVPTHTLFLVNEGSTPFTNLHFIHGWTDWRRTANGVLMFLTFLVFRVLFSAVLMARLFYYVYFGADGLRGRGDAHELVFLLQFLMGFCLVSLNLFWFAKITKGLLKSLRGVMGAGGGGGKGAGEGKGGKAPADEAPPPVEDEASAAPASSTSASPSPKAGGVRRRGVVAS